MMSQSELVSSIAWRSTTRRASPPSTALHSTTAARTDSPACNACILWDLWQSCRAHRFVDPGEKAVFAMELDLAGAFSGVSFSSSSGGGGGTKG